MATVGAGAPVAGVHDDGRGRGVSLDSITAAEKAVVISSIWAWV
ncbi:hypothetical protein [Sorangium sp. So ce1151]